MVNFYDSLSMLIKKQDVEIKRKYEEERGHRKCVEGRGCHLENSIGHYDISIVCLDNVIFSKEVQLCKMIST